MNHPSQSLYDLSYLNQVFQGNRQMIEQIIALFLEQVPAYVKEMNELSQQGHFEALHPLAHKAKSSVAMLGMKETEELLLKIEFESKNFKNKDGLKDMAAQLSHHIQVACNSLRKELATSSAA